MSHGMVLEIAQVIECQLERSGERKLRRLELRENSMEAGHHDE